MTTQLTTVTGRYLGPDDYPAGGTVEFMLSASVYDADDQAIRPQVKVTRTLDPSGAFTVDLMPGADSGVTITGTLTYRVVERIIGAPHRTYYVEIPVGTTVDLGTLAPQGTPPPVTGGGGGAVDSVNGYTGVVVLAASDVDADPAGAAATTALQAPTLETALPNLFNAIVNYNDATTPELRQIDMGSSVGQGPDGGYSATNSVGTYLFNALGPILNRLGNLNLAHYNECRAGTSVSDGNNTDYATAKTAAGGTPTLVPLIYGMNDGTMGQYHYSQTLPGIYTHMTQLIAKIQADGGDPIILTSPHVNTDTYVWNWTGTIWYPPGGVMIPDAAHSLATVKTADGRSVVASYRHLRANDMMRKVAYDMGCVLIDAERYWFDAIATHGTAALFASGQTVHPNLFGFQQSYFKAIDDFVAGLKWPTVRHGVMAGARPVGDRPVYAGTTPPTNLSAVWIDTN